MKTCKTCRHCVVVSEADGWCRLNPPHLVGLDPPRSQLIPVSVLGLCSHHRRWGMFTQLWRAIRSAWIFVKRPVNKQSPVV